ncbi:CHAT domain-containing protein, partial [Roseateles sp. P5_E11]
YCAEVRSEIGDKLWSSMFEGRKRLLTICDFPIEWLPVCGLPAMFRCEMSRVPSTPGNVTAQVALTHPRTVVPRSALDHVLVIRSFGAEDPIRDHLKLAVDRFDLGALRVDYVDVSTRDELVDAMNGYGGALLIFDCHGNHGGKTEHAWLQIGKERVDVWDLKHAARMAPVVVLAACSTHPLNGSHASVANGFLANGVQAVLGTYAPVDATHAAVLVARLLYRISAYLPMVTKHRPLSWREIVGTFFRMSYTSDVLMDLHWARKAIDEAQFRQLHGDANMAINAGDDSWFEKLQEGVKQAASMNDAELRAVWAARYQFVETMLFGQLGRPENITIVSDEVYFERSSVDGAEASEAPSVA